MPKSWLKFQWIQCACKIRVLATKAAVSARKTAEPKWTGVIWGFWANRATSSGLHPPSGPTKNPRAMGFICDIGIAASNINTHAKKSHPWGVLGETYVVSGIMGCMVGMVQRRLCSQASWTIFMWRFGQKWRTVVRRHRMGKKSVTPNSTAFSISQFWALMGLKKRAVVGGWGGWGPNGQALIKVIPSRWARHNPWFPLKIWTTSWDFKRMTLDK